MSWSLDLSTYPRSILKNELPLLILSLIERSGLTTEEEIGRKVNIKSKKLKRILIDLQLNNLLEYGKHYFSATEKAKYLIDRFELGGSILEDVLEFY